MSVAKLMRKGDTGGGEQHPGAAARQQSEHDAAVQREERDDGTGQYRPLPPFAQGTGERDS
jgi:hypothetical protein